MNDDEKIDRPSFGDPKLVVDRSERSCSHEFVRLFATSERVVCRVCRAEVDPFQVLMKLAREWDWCVYRSRELSDLDAKLMELKREESNVKARLRAAHKLAAPEPKAKVYFDELMRRFSEVKTSDDLFAVARYASDFKWLPQEQYEILTEARKRAERRIEDERGRKRVVRRGVRVIDGGKKTEPADA